MKIDDILKESDEENVFDEIIKSDFFKINILPYIDRPPHEMPLLFHGGTMVLTQGDGEIYHIETRTRPTDSVPLFHDAINQVSENVFGTKVRNLLFASRDQDTAENYGVVALIIPLDRYNLYYSNEYTDMFGELNMSRNDMRKQRKDYVVKAINTLQTQSLFSDIDSLITKKSSGDSSEISKDVISVMNGSITHDELKALNLNKNHKNIEELKGTYNKRTISHVRDILIDAVYYIYTMDTIVNSEHYEKIMEILWNVASTLVDIIIKSDIKFLRNTATKYINTIEKTTVVNDIPEAHEIMCSPGRYAVFKMEGLNNFKAIGELIAHYDSKRN